MSRRIPSPRRLRWFVRELARQPRPMRGAYLRAVLDGRVPYRAPYVIAALTDVTVRQARALLGEPHARRAAEVVDAAELEYAAETGAAGAGLLLPEEGRLLYALVRALAPEVVVETGTANGSSTYFLLAALERNGHGRLISIDLPFVGTARAPIVAGSSIGEWDASPIPEGRQPGWIVPDRLRSRWELRLGDARKLLPQVEAPVDLFFHDSLHSREHMLFEFETIWPRLRSDGVLASDDVFQRRHDALAAFSTSVERPFLTFRKLGFVRRK